MMMFGCFVSCSIVLGAWCALVHRGHIFFAAVSCPLFYLFRPSFHLRTTGTKQVKDSVNVVTSAHQCRVIVPHCHNVGRICLLFPLMKQPEASECGVLSSPLPCVQNSQSPRCISYRPPSPPLMPLTEADHGKTVLAVQGEVLEVRRWPACFYGIALNYLVDGIAWL